MATCRAPGFWTRPSADAAFALPGVGVSDVVKGQFGPAIVRVAQITPASVKPYEEVADQLKSGIALDRAANDALTLHDKIEDARVSGKTLGEAAKSLGLDARAIAAIDASGLDKSGGAVEGLDDKAEVLRAVFASDVGVDDPPLATAGSRLRLVRSDQGRAGARPLGFDEVKDRVAAQWREDQIAKALAAKAADMAQKVNAGATLASLAEPDKLEVKTASDVHRRGGGGSNEAVVAALFNTSSSGAGSAATPEGRVVFKVTADSTPPVDFDDAKVKALAANAAAGLSDDLIAEYVSALERRLGVSVNENALQAAEGS